MKEMQIECGRMLPVIKWSGSKRSQADCITKLFPRYETYFEPFLGGGSVLIHACPERAVCGDICKPLIEFWQKLKDEPISLVEEYTKRWMRMQEEGYLVFYDIRDNFNRKQNPDDLLFLSRTCVNGLIRFNRDGKFNNSLHHTRKGIEPARLERLIFGWHKLIQDYEFVFTEYYNTTKTASCKDFVYLDPPYFNTKGRYYGKIDYASFIEYLDKLNARGVKYLLSFDGMRGQKDFTVDIPKELYKRHYLLDSGNASFKKVMDKSIEKVQESVYLNY